MKIKIKVLFIMLIIFIAISTMCKGSVYAASPTCNVNVVLSSSSVLPDEELDVVVSLADIKEPIAGVGFTFEYNSNLFEYINYENTSGWTVAKTENSFEILTANLEGTIKSGSVVTIKLKAKSAITVSSTDSIALTSVEITKDNATTEKLDDINKVVNITVNQTNDANKEDNKMPTQSPIRESEL